ncbi:NAD(P)H-quinone oxidoreductase [Hydrogenophaga sp. SNF1]|uniref:NAD(P)H-quinone oxidoreductase n=1 Tax=Hydrogenophaga sp. SNF1 TaxID=3098762 RepID=UPI002ACC0E0B|nr:NAD(P)H-quinone oxidoreductase [Hydrogenophaga sp. SNF1]WQB84713.1 NAD(P)H-quinone oxidoreductase [Hydrogenophaga sp. SNF1]
MNASLMQTRNTAIFITAAGEPEVLQVRSADMPTPAEDELLVEVAFAGVNRHDCNQRRRGPTPAHCDIPGLEVSGTVRAVGAKVRGIAVGTLVCALADGGGYARFACVPAAHAFEVPEGISLEQAAALPEALFTVWHNFFGVAQLAGGESVLVHGGTSGVGSVAIQLLSALGHPVYATCGSEAKCEIAMGLGATAAIHYRAQAFEQEVARLTQGRGVDVVLDMAGAAYGARNLQALAHRGRMVHLAPGDGADFSAPLRTIMAKEAKITGSLLRPLPTEEKTLIARRLRQVAWPLVGSGRVRPLIEAVLPLENAAEAHRRLESGAVAGKLLLSTAPGGSV